MSAVLKAICGIMGEIGSIEKAGFNKFHQYKFVQASDVMHKLQPLLVKHGLIILQTEHSRSLIGNGEAMSIQYHFYLAHVEGEVWTTPLEQTGLATCVNSKGGFDDKAANKCATAAHKYMVINLFKIPTGEFDDADSQEDAKRHSAANDNEQSPRVVPVRVTETAPGELPAVFPVDPKHGLVGRAGDMLVVNQPHAIDLTKKPKSDAVDWVAWGSRLVAGINAAVTTDELSSWIKENQSALEKCEKAAPKVFKTITTRIAEAHVLLPIIGDFARARTKDDLNAAWEKKHANTIKSLETVPYDRLAASFEYHVNRVRESSNPTAA